MREITRKMIDEFEIDVLGYDMMGYNFRNLKELSFHHLVIPRRLCNNRKDKGYNRENGAILKQDSSHSYLHLIELYDRSKFLEITKYLVEENKLGKIDIDILKSIRRVLESFEKEYKELKGANKKLIIKREFTNRIEL